jgi:hypothetical protein
MNSGTSLKFLMWFFGFFVYLAFVCVQAAKLGRIPKSSKREFRRREVLFQLSLYIPIIVYIGYFYAEEKVSLVECFILFGIPFVLVAGQSYFINRPQLKTFIPQAEDLFKTLDKENAEVRFSFNPKKAQIILHNDSPAYVDNNLYDFRIDRVCKNEYGEYFWVEASVEGFFKPTVKYLNEHGAKNLLRQYRDVYLQEFSEEPYYKSK